MRLSQPRQATEWQIAENIGLSGFLLSVNVRRRNLLHESFQSVFEKRPISNPAVGIRGLYHYKSC